MTTCKCRHNEDDHREGVFECGASIIHQGAEFFCGCEDFEPAEPSTEGTQAAQPQFGFFRCLSCGFNGTISTDEIAKHRAQCSHGTTVPMSQAEWEARGEPAPVAQVDAGKCHHIWGWDRVCMACGEDSLEPAAAQTELPPIPAASDCIMDFPQAFAFIAATAADENIHHPKCSYRRARMLCDCSIVWAEYYKRQVASLTQRLQASEAREAELKAEIAKMQMDNVIDYKAACEQHAANYEALERSHKALLQALIQIRDDHCGMGELEPETISTACEAIAAAEKL